MMHITLQPQRRDDTLTVVKSGEVLLINGDEVDLSGVTEENPISPEDSPHPFIVGTVERNGGVLHLNLVLPHGPDASDAARFPQPIIDPPDGPLALPE